MSLTRTHALLREVVADRAAPCVVVEVGRHQDVLWREAAGHLTYAPDAPAATTATVFDLASLTKVIVTTSLCQRAVSAGLVTLETPVRTVVPEWNRGDTASVTIRDVLCHAAGLPAHVRLWERALTREDALRVMLSVDCERPVRSSSVYSDIGFMLLGVLLERLHGETLRDLWLSACPPAITPLDFCPMEWHASAAVSGGIAPTEEDPWRGRLLHGEVHDENAALLGGIAGHAGLFGSVDAVGAFAREVLRTFHESTWLGLPSVQQEFARRVAVPGTSRALGWDTMLPTSSCGTLLSPTAIGHTGFTGTSLWIDWEQDLYVVVLSNRVHPTRSNERFPPMRARIHDAVVHDLRAPLVR